MFFISALADLLLIYQIAEERRLMKRWPLSTRRLKVVVPVRGHDPAIAECVRSLLSQDHPDYSVIFLADEDELDEQRKTIEPLGGIVEAVTLPCEGCTGKVRAVRQAIIKYSGENLVFADSDTIYPRDWLSQMAGALESSPAATSFSWPLPLRPTFVNLLRAGFWTLGFESWAFNGTFMWGGSMALRSELVGDELAGHLLGKWCDDCAVGEFVKKRGTRIAFAGGAMPLNAFDEKRIWGWASRQAIIFLRHSKRGTYSFLAIAFMLLAVLISSIALKAALLDLPFLLWVIKNMLRGIKYGKRAILPSLFSIPAIFFAAALVLLNIRSRKIEWRGRVYAV